jgi:S-adenosylmethionine-diacylglycerol 3-amino-3-carboxypropyl transferase
LVEPNPAQVVHLKRKLKALGRFEPAEFNIATDNADALHECGNFERLFRLLRTVLDLFVIPADVRAERLSQQACDWRDVFEHPYWPGAFSTAFDDAVLTVMFGPNAVQHARPGSYPAYFRGRIEAGLTANDSAHNPWLHHVLLGHYLSDREAWPPFLQNPPRDLGQFAVLPSTLQEVASFAPFDFVLLSNVLDWMDDASCRALADRLSAEMSPGAHILWRQLNDPRDLVDNLVAAFEFSAARDAELATRERSLFYDRVHLGTHR